MKWLFKWIITLPKATLDFRRDYNLSRKCQKIEKKEGVIAGAIYMYSKVIDEVKPILISELLTYVSNEEEGVHKEIYYQWLMQKGVEYGFITKQYSPPKPVKELEDWHVWENQE